MVHLWSLVLLSPDNFFLSIEIDKRIFCNVKGRSARIEETSFSLFLNTYFTIIKLHVRKITIYSDRARNSLSLCTLPAMASNDLLTIFSKIFYVPMYHIPRYYILRFFQHTLLTFLHLHNHVISQVVFLSKDFTSRNSYRTQS